MHYVLAQAALLIPPVPLPGSMAFAFFSRRPHLHRGQRSHQLAWEAWLCFRWHCHIFMFFRGGIIYLAHKQGKTSNDKTRHLKNTVSQMLPAASLSQPMALRSISALPI